MCAHRAHHVTTTDHTDQAAAVDDRVAAIPLLDEAFGQFEDGVVRADPGQIDSLIDAVLGKFNNIDILINL